MVWPQEDITVDDFIDIIEGNRRYIKCLYVYNKVRYKVACGLSALVCLKLQAQKGCRAAEGRRGRVCRFTVITASGLL